MIARIKRVRLTITDPTCRPAKVNKVEVAENSKEVVIAAISPIYKFNDVPLAAIHFEVISIQWFPVKIYCP